jgi:hypothetical protein
LKFLSEYEFEIKNIKRKENQVVDAPNKRAHEMDVATINMYKINIKYKIIEATNSDQHYLQIKQTLQQGNLQQKFKDFELKEDEIIMHKGKVYVLNSNDLKNMVMREMKNVLYAGNQGYQKMIAVVRSQYFWPRMKK